MKAIGGLAVAVAAVVMGLHNYNTYGSPVTVSII